MLRDEIKEIFAKPFLDIDKIMCLEALVEKEISQVKKQYEEEKNVIYNKFEQKLKQFRDTTEKQNSLLKTVEIEKEHLESQYLGYRQAIKDILESETERAGI